MWYKWLGLGVLCLMGGYFLLSGERQGPVEQKGPLLRLAEDIVMNERDLSAREGLTTITARRAEERDDQTVILDEFEISQAPNLIMKGRLARYDMHASVLYVTGPVSVTTGDGIQATLTGLVWQRDAGTARTDNPVQVVMEQGTVEVARAEFDDDFGRIRFSGGVHAKISPHLIDR